MLGGEYVPLSAPPYIIYVHLTGRLCIGVLPFLIPPSGLFLLFFPSLLLHLFDKMSLWTPDCHQIPYVTQAGLEPDILLPQPQPLSGWIAGTYSSESFLHKKMNLSN